MIPRQTRKLSAMAGIEHSQSAATRSHRSLSWLSGRRLLPFALQALVFILLGVISDRIVIRWQNGETKDVPLSAPSPARESPQNILVPSASTPKAGPAAIQTTTPTSGPLRYLIQPGDTLLGIASRYRVSVQSIQDANSLSGDLIVAGEYLLIPQPTPSSR